MSRSLVNRIGFWSSIMSVVFALGYCVAEILSTLKIIPHPQNLFWLFLPSLFLAPAFMVAIICLHYATEKAFRVVSAIGVAFAILYCANVSIVYFSQLTVVLPAQLKGSINDKRVLLFDRKTFLMAVDCLGYFFMSLSTFFAAFAFKDSKWLYRGLLWNGALMPVLILAFFYPVYYYLGAIWMVTFPLAMINAARFFKGDLQMEIETSIEYETRYRMAPGTPNAKESNHGAKN